jgi:hypothetical protein
MHSALLTPDFSAAALGQVCEAPLAEFLSLLLATAALHKALRPDRARRAVAELTGLDWTLAGWALAMAAAAEALAALGLEWSVSRRDAALLAAGLWAAYGACIAAALLRGRRDLDCGCSFGATHRPLGRFHLVRNALLVALALGVALLAAIPGQPGSIDAGAIDAAVAVDGVGAGVRLASAALAALALFALYGALDHVMALGELRRGGVR